MFEKILISALRKVVSDTAFFDKKYAGNMYHGSVTPVTAWHINNMGQFGKGLYLALDRKWAEFHAEGGRQGKAGQRPSKEKGYVYEFQVSGNALVIRDEEEFFKELIGENEEAEEAFSRTGDLYSKAISRCTADYARDKGYDLVIFDPKNSDVLTPFPQAIILNPKSFKLKNKPTVKAGAQLKLYHGTTKENANSLLKFGWKGYSPKGSNVGQSKYLYVTNVYDNALWYADRKGDTTVLEVIAPLSHLSVDPEDGIGDDVDDELMRTKKLGLPANLVVTKPLPSSAFKNTTTIKAETAEATLIGYHGTPRSKFDTLKMDQKPTSKQIYGKGLYFTSKKNSAITFAVGKHGQVFTVDLSSLNLWDARHDLKTTTALAKKLKIKPPTSEEMKNDGWNYILQQREKQPPEMMVGKLIETLKSLGFDGIIVPFQSSMNLPNGRVIDGEDWYVVYKNEDKIKYLKKESKVDC
jgi:hypothetical protein